MGDMLEIFILLVLVGGIVFLIMRRRGAGRPGGPSSQMAQGTLLVTGASSGAESGGSQNVTITGVINGPTVREHEVYAQMVMGVGSAPTIGQLVPIVYSAKNPDKWGFASTRQPPPPPQQPPPPPQQPPPPDVTGSGTELR